MIDYNIHYCESTSPSTYNNTFIRTPTSEIEKGLEHFKDATEAKIESDKSFLKKIIEASVYNAVDKDFPLLLQPIEYLKYDAHAQWDTKGTKYVTILWKIHMM